MDSMTKRDHFIRVKSSKGNFSSVVRERYLREDISCHSGICKKCIQGDGLLRLSKDVTHYLVPDCQAALQYLDIFEFQEISGVIFMQTCIEYIMSKVGRRQLQRFKKLFQDARHDCVVFSNVFHKHCFASKLGGETNNEWNERLVYEAAVWYYKHLEGKLPIVMISDNPKVREKFGDLTVNVFVLAMGDYLKTFHSIHQNIFDVFESLDAAIHDNSQTQGGVVGETIKEYKEYIPVDVLETEVKLGRYIQGRLKVNKYNPKEAFVTPVSENLSKENEKLEDILIPTVGLRNRAVHGDNVVVAIMPKDQGKEKLTSSKGSAAGTVAHRGRIVGVLQRNWRDYVASFDEQEALSPGKRSGKVLVVPFDCRIPKIRISTTQIEKLKNHRIVVRIDNWKTDSLYPFGHFIRSLGLIGELKTETSVILVEHSLLTLPFTDAQLREMPKNDPENPLVIEEEEVIKRKDLRDTYLIFTIDPKGCEDVDDSLSVRELQNGDIELGVHIADVTHFVKPNSFTDLEAKSRSTTVYLADRRFDMLPSILSSDLCSLLSGVDSKSGTDYLQPNSSLHDLLQTGYWTSDRIGVILRERKAISTTEIVSKMERVLAKDFSEQYAVSLIWILDKDDYEVKDVWYGKTIIRSRYKLFYEIAQVIAEGKISNSELAKDIPELQIFTSDSELDIRVKELRWCVLKLMDIARKLKSKRKSQGALELEGGEVQVRLDEKREIEDLVPKDPLEVHETIAECMIFANHWVAKRILKSFPSCSLLRRHPLPRQDQFSNVINCAKFKGFVVDTSSNKSLASSLDRCVDPHDQTFNKIMRSLTTQAMSNALYFSTGALSQDQYFHYGLALDKYTHFTSPIRRYADVIVHRQLMMAIGYDKSQPMLSNQELQEVTINMNTKHRESKKAQRDSVQLFQALYFRNLDENDERRISDGVVFQTRENGVLVAVERYGLKGPLVLKNSDGHVVCPSNSNGDGVEYVPGSLTKSEFEITVKNGCGTFHFQLFDHLKVRICVSHSRARGDSIKLELASCYPYKVSKSYSMTEEEIKLQKQQLIKDVKGNNEETITKSENEKDLSELTRLMSIFGQTHEDVSLYCLLEDLKDKSLRE